MKRFVALYFFASVLLFSCSAQKQITNLPPGVTQQQVQNWDTAVQTLDKIAVSTSTLRQAIVALHQNGVITDAQVYGKILTSLGMIDDAQIDAANFLKAQPDNWGSSMQTKVKNDLALISAELQAITQQQLLGIKNAGAQQQIQQIVAEITSGVSLILSLVTA
jgi:hypothetical protein